MTADQFRQLALDLPEATEKEHMGHPDFRVRNKVFATLGPNEAWGMVKLTPAQQRTYVRLYSKAFRPWKGAWGKRGCTEVILSEADENSLSQALQDAWRNVVPKSMLSAMDDA